MQIINIPSLFLLYSAISFFTSILLQSLFHGRKDASANLWIWSCLLSAIATFGTVFREYVPPLIGYTLMVALETVAMLLQSTSLTNLYKNNKSIFPPSGIYLLIIFLFVQYVLIYVGEGKVTPLMSAFTAVSWMLVSFYNTRSSLKVVKLFENNYFIKRRFKDEVQR